MNRTLDYVPRLVEANRAYRMTAADPSLLQRSRYWTPGYPVLDQGAEGACVGFGCTGEAMASPVRVRYANPGDVAREWYRAAQRLDEWEGEAYDGTSVRAGMLIGRDSGHWSGFRWAFNMLELRAALEEGPVVVGVEWREGMYEPVAGGLRPVGEVVGGHCLLVTGYTPDKWKFGPHYRLRNSWGAAWGANGSAYIHELDLEDVLFKAGGEAAVVSGRAL